MKPKSSLLKRLSYTLFIFTVLCLTVSAHSKKAKQNSSAPGLVSSNKDKLPPPTQQGECHISVVSAQDNGKTSLKSEKLKSPSKEDCSLQSKKYKSAGVDVFFRWKVQSTTP